MVYDMQFPIIIITVVNTFRSIPHIPILTLTVIENRFYNYCVYVFFCFVNVVRKEPYFLKIKLSY